MKKNMLKTLFTALLISIICILPAKAVGSDMLKVGIYYSSNALPAANLQNVTGIGYGYEVGYFDADRQFVSLYGITDHNKITMVKDKLIYIDSSNTYYDVKPSSFTTMIAPYHLQLNTQFETKEEMDEAITLLKDYGLTAFPAFADGMYAVRSGQYETHAKAEEALLEVAELTGLDFSVCGYSNTCYTVTVTSTNTILFEYDNGGPLAIMPVYEEGKAQTWFKGYKYYGGFEYNRVNGNDISVINYVTEDDYAKGVVPYEVNPTWHEEVLKVQALCAKSYAQNCIGKHKSQGFDICDTTHCQVYNGTNQATAKSDAACEAVSGQYVVYDGKIANTFFHASSGGHTEDVENIWGSKINYLRGVPDDYLKYTNSPYENWSYKLSLDKITKILKSKGYSVTNITDFYVSKYSQYGNVLQLAFVDETYGRKTVSGDTARTLLNSSTYGVTIYSHRYTVTSDSAGVYIGNRQVRSISDIFAIGADFIKKAITGNWNDIKVLSKDGVSTISTGSGSSDIIIQGSGSGHNIGMSQWGARGMAENGINYIDIIKHYFTGVEVGNVD